MLLVALIYAMFEKPTMQREHVSTHTRACTSAFHCGLTVFPATLERFSWPWCGREGKMLCFPGWMDSFR